MMRCKNEVFDKHACRRMSTFHELTFIVSTVQPSLHFYKPPRIKAISILLITNSLHLTWQTQIPTVSLFYPSCSSSRLHAQRANCHVSQASSTSASSIPSMHGNPTTVMTPKLVSPKPGILPALTYVVLVFLFSNAPSILMA